MKVYYNRMRRLVEEGHAQLANSAKTEQDLKANVRGMGYGN
jgi:hypothetical protein